MTKVTGVHLRAQPAPRPRAVVLPAALMIVTLLGWLLTNSQVWRGAFVGTVAGTVVVIVVGWWRLRHPREAAEQVWLRTRQHSAPPLRSQDGGRGFELIDESGHQSADSMGRDQSPRGTWIVAGIERHAPSPGTGSGSPKAMLRYRFTSKQAAVIVRKIGSGAS